ncbi:MAG: alpha-L-fucosidase [Chloroflexi bacterium]|nr:MAG: alpha-L-fucosidase [Chloroflexota bacterium]
MFEPSWESLTHYTVPQWYQDAKFGIFVHWGVYAVPAFNNEWYPRNMYQQGSPEFEHHMRTYGPQTEFGYKDFIPCFTGDKFDPDAWARLFKEAGAKYVIPVAEHHDGFAMYDCSFGEWNAVKMGPQRDVIGELAAAIRAHGMVFGLSSHRAEHYWFFDGGRQFPSDVQDSRYADLYGAAQPQDTQPDPAFLHDWLARARELVDKYEPQIVYFDWWIKQPFFTPYVQQFAAYYYNHDLKRRRGVVINYKEAAFPEGAAVFDVERGQLAGIRALPWQTDTSVAAKSWCYVENQEYKPAGSLIGDLVDIVSKNGRLLLNIGPRADGTIPDQDQAILREIGRWLAVNGEAIHGTRPWIMFGEGPTEISAGQFTDTQRKPFTSQDIRFTSKPNTLYAICLGWPEAHVTIHSLGISSTIKAAHIAAITLLGSPEPLTWTQHQHGLTIQLPQQRPCDHAYAFKLALRDSS